MKTLVNLKETFNKSNMDRRTFMNRAVVTGASVASAVTIGQSASASAPKRGGKLRVASNGASTTDLFDSAGGTNNNWTFLLWNTVFNRLTYINNDNKLEPELATDWNVAKGGLSWVVNLRKGVQWHDGSEFTADDAVWSLMRHIAKGSKSNSKGQMSAWKEVKKTGKHQITIYLNSPDADTPYVLNQTGLAMVKKGTTDWRNPVGTGSYKVEKFEPGVRFVGKRNENYFKKDAGYFDSVEFIAINDDTARINALLSGAVDVIREVPFELASRIEKHSRYNVVRSDVGQYLCNDMQCKTGFTKDNNVRLALKYGTDRQKILDVVLNGYGSIGNDQPISPNDPLFNANIPQRAFDTDKAKYYWKKSGLGNTEVAYNTSSSVYAGSIKHAAVLQEGYKKAGINFKINNNPSDGYWSSIWGKKAYVANYWGRRPTSSTTFSNAYSTTSPGNKTGFSDEKFDSLLVQLKRETNESVRKEISGDMQVIVHEKGGVGIPVFYAVLDAGSTKVKGLDSHGIFGLNNYRIAEKGWFA